MSTQDVNLHHSLPAGTTARFVVASAAYISARAMVDASGNPIASSNPLPTTQVSVSASVTYGAMQVVEMGNGSAKEIVPANANRKALVLTNVSDTPAHLSINDNTVTSARYVFYIGEQETLILDTPITQQSIWAADAGAANKNLVYQEAV